ncbi:RNA polymerase factor sigma C [Solibacillus sp. R5-41]|uniref:sigma-70 family RNA polymerase sigma factor n=1 Tax=Solibacillus sp. R5-41 TaxID=2048654 RepID=UPI000C128E63|nr:sigma-70 family RNA polymerase sigma factor [Solibacillus sp. R5-41]ATP41260.1 RNA polymerase factor sigma C [Solibacillus sp. R5-41]
MDSYLMQTTTTQTNEEIIDELMNTYGQDVLQLVVQYVHNVTIAEDLTQEIFIKCYKALPTFQQQSSIKTWLWRIAINHTKDYLKCWYFKKVDLIEQTYLQEQTSHQTVETIVIQRDEDYALVNAVMQLPIKYREVIYLCYYEEQTMKEIADVLQVNENTIKTRLRKGKRLLKKQLEGEFNG